MSLLRRLGQPPASSTGSGSPPPAAPTPPPVAPPPATSSTPPPPAAPAAPTPPVTTVTSSGGYVMRFARAATYVLSAVVLVTKLLWPFMVTLKLLTATMTNTTLVVGLVFACAMLAREPRVGRVRMVGMFLVLAGSLAGLAFLK